MKDLKNLFYPKSVAVFGATNKKHKVGYALCNNLKNFNSKLYFINPRLSKQNTTLFKNKFYSSILDIPSKTLDLAIIAVPSNFVLDIIESLGSKKCHDVILITAGFNESGNSRLTNKLMYLIKKNKINLVGPNCLGILNQDVNFDGTFNSTKLKKPNFGNISIISQSGALGSAILDVARNESLGINKFVSYGNALDIDECDLLEYLNTDKKTDVILSYIEGVQDGRKFFNILKKVSKNKKIIIIKGGISAYGSSAAKSHTAAIAGSSKVFASAVKQAGAYLVDSVEDLFDLAKLFSIYKNQKINNIQLITNGGGFGVLCIDQLSKNNINFSQISTVLKNKLQAVLPSYAVISNPLDLTGDATSDRFIDCLNICDKNKSVDSIALLLLFQLPGIDDSIIPKLIRFRKKTKKPLFVLGIGGNNTSQNLKLLSENKIVCFKDPKHLSNALKYFVH